MRKPLAICFVLAVAATSGGATDCGQVFDDPGFDVWCGDTLCAWRVEKGAVARAPTWHQADNGVALVGPDVAISQFTDVESRDGHCLEFSLVADVAADAEVQLQFDLYGDGSVEHEERIPTSDWDLVVFRVRMPETYAGVRFRLAKQGGHAVLANVGAQVVPDYQCPGDPLVVGPGPVGTACTRDADCTGGLCGDGDPPDGSNAGGVCQACELGDACPNGGVCSFEPIWEGSGPDWSCRPPGSAPLGTICVSDADCAAGSCVGLRCGLCRDDAECGGGICTPVTYAIDDGRDPAATVLGGHHCVGGSGGTAASGAPCLVDGDCASGACGGEPLRACANESSAFLDLLRECRDDFDCAPDFGPYPTCVTVGTRGGVCQ